MPAQHRSQRPYLSGFPLSRVALLAGVVSLAALLSGCPGATPPAGSGTSSSPGGTASGGSVKLEFWHTRRGSQEDLLKAVCDEYEAKNPNVQLEPVYQGNYDALNKKIRASIQAKSVPALAVAYESHVTEYMANEVVRPLDDLVKEPETGLSEADLADIPEQYLASNRYKQFNNQLLSFPFTKSNLVMYYNKTLLKKAGFDAPPATWDEFEKQAAAVTRLIGKPAYACNPDPSTLDGIIYSFGGQVLDESGVSTQFDQPAAVKAFEMLGRMAKSKTLVEATGDDVGGLFIGQSCAFALDSSSGRKNMEEGVGSQFDWDIAIIPHAEGVQPVTVMYGPNICIFKGTPERERESWKFVKYFTSPEVTARWARETGYLPVRKSAVELPEMKAFYQQNPRAQHVYDILPSAKGEPNVVGWQEVRDQLAAAARAVISGANPIATATGLKKKADQTLAQSKTSP
jgi:ABC-type glycerol-3-phosphate transport system substrate-binding protein